MRLRMQCFVAVAAVVVIAAAGIAAYVWFGAYDIGADSPHGPVTATFLAAVRDRSVARYSASVSVPDLDDEKMILTGAAHYKEMCEQCHLAPGENDSEIRAGLYPQPPNLSEMQVDPRIAFWVVKHGIKMSAMPAWGKTHDDATIWDIVAFVEKLPQFSPVQYRAVVAEAPPIDDPAMSRHRPNNDERR